MSVKVSRTRDRELIRSVVLHPEVANDFGATEESIAFHESIYWLAAYVGEVLAGVLVFIPIYGTAWNPHIAILPELRGNGIEAMRSGVAWMFENTPAEKILAFPFKPIMLRVYEQCGFRVEGHSKALVRRGVELIDCTIVGIEKGAAPC